MKDETKIEEKIGEGLFRLGLMKEEHIQDTILLQKAGDRRLFGEIAVEKGYVVTFERMTSLVKLLKTSEIQRSSAFRLNRILKSDLVIIDEIGYSPIERKEANLFFNLVSELYEKKSIIITSNKNFNEWAEMLGDAIMTTALLDRLLHHSKIFNLKGESFRIQKIKQKEV